MPRTPCEKKKKGELKHAGMMTKEKDSQANWETD
jgi:hypothetical protein